MIEFLILFIEIFVLFNIIMGLASLNTWVERKGSALIQDRVGANRAGAFTEAPVLILKPFYAVWRALGILGVINTLLCDAVKALFKEDFVPQGVSNFMHCLAPFMALVPVFLAFAIVPLAPEFQLFGHTIRFQVAEINAGVLFFLAMGSIAVYGVALAGWTSNNKFSLLGSLRASAQMISYELAMGVAIATAILMYGTLDLYAMVERQRDAWGIFQGLPFMLVAGIIFFVCGMAETKRGPFDLPESESELVAGYFTEYSGMKFLLFWLGEFAEIALFSLVLSLIFLGGWHPLPFANSVLPLEEGTWWAALIGHAVLMGKVVVLSVLQIVIRWTLPRFRYDLLMNLGWKVLLEISFVNLMLAGAWVVYMSGK